MVAAPSTVSRVPTTSLKSSITKPARLRSTPINFSENFMEQKSAGFMDAVVGLKMINMAASHSNSRSDLSDDGSFSSGTASPRSGTVSPDPALRVLADAAAPSPQKIDLAFCSRLCDASSGTPRPSARRLRSASPAARLARGRVPACRHALRASSQSLFVALRCECAALRPPRMLKSHE